jgi:hypothetical protein
MVNDYGKFIQSIVTPSSHQNVIYAAADPDNYPPKAQFRSFQHKFRTTSQAVQRVLSSE